MASVLTCFAGLSEECLKGASIAMHNVDRIGEMGSVII
jgi:hypothetical protein